MSEQIDLSKLEKQTWKLRTKDGFLEITLGIILLMVAGQYVTGIPLAFIVFLPVLLLIQIKKNILTPRIGKIKIGPYRKKKELQYGVLMTGAVLLFVPIMIYSTKYLQLNITVILLTSILAIIFSFQAYFLEYPLLLLHGTLYTISVIACNVTTTIAGPAIAAISGVILIIIGIIILIDFLDKYPVIQPETIYERL